MINQKPHIGKNTSGIRRLPRAIKCSLNGYKVAWQFESGFRQYACLSLLLLPFCYLLAQSAAHGMLLLGSLVFLLFAEIVNSAVEAVSDALTSEYNELIGRAKDLGSAAVFTALLFLIALWLHAVVAYLV